MTSEVRSPCNQKTVLWFCITLFILISGTKRLFFVEFDLAQQWIADVVTKVLLPSILLWVIHRFAGITSSDFGLSKRSAAPIRELISGSIVSFFILFLADLVGTGVGRLLAKQYASWLPVFYSYAQLIPERGIERALAAIYLAFSAGIVEEIFYRGLLLILLSQIAWLKNNFNLYYVVISSVLFASVHWGGGLINVVEAFGFGLAASILYIKFRDLRSLIVSHSFVDLAWLL